MKTLLAALLIAASTVGASAPAKSVAIVHIKNFRYGPNIVTVHVGDRVTFVNDDDEAHTVTAADHSFDSAGMDTKDSWQHEFTKAGRFSYFCELHPYMKATVIVLPVKKS